MSANFHLQNPHILITTIFKHIPQYIFWKDLNSVYLGCNDHYAHLLGLASPADIIGKTDYEIGWLADGNTADSFRVGDQKTLAGESITNHEEWLSLPNGAKLLTLTSKVPLLDAAQQIVGVLGVCTDITDKHQTEQRLAETRHQLKGMSIVGASIAHELRTPLTLIKNAVISLRHLLPPLIQGYKAAQSQQLPIPVLNRHHIALLKTVVDQLEQPVDQAHHVIEMLLANIQAFIQGQTQLARCSMKRCIQQALARYPFVTEKKPAIVWDDLLDFEFEGQEWSMIHVLFNLLKNALYFIDQAGKGEIHIWLNQQSDHNTLHFKDTGAGIQKKYLSQIFDPFFTQLTNKGHGIGLAFCQMTLELWGGSIQCQSVYHHYTEFILRFPKPTTLQVNQ